MTNTPEEQKHCCPKFDPSLWDEKTQVWQDKLFLKDTVCQFMHMPLNIKKVIARMWQTVQKAEAAPADTDFLLLAYDPSPWKSELHMTITKEIPESENVRLSGTFLTKVFDGPYNAAPKWIKAMEQYVASQGKKVRKYYFHYPYCPACAKAYGHNYAIIFAETE